MLSAIGPLPIEFVEVALRIAEASHGETSAGVVQCPLCVRGVLAYAVMRGPGLLLLVECSTEGCVRVSHP